MPRSLRRPVRIQIPCRVEPPQLHIVQGRLKRVVLHIQSKARMHIVELAPQGRDVRPQHKHFPRAIVQLRHAWYPGDAPDVVVELLQWHVAVREREPNQGVGRVDRLARSSAISVRPSMSCGGSGCARKDVPEHGGRLPQLSIDWAYHVSRNHAVSLQNVHVNSDSDPGMVCFVALEFTIMGRRWRCGWCAVIVKLHTEIRA